MKPTKFLDVLFNHSKKAQLTVFIILGIVIIIIFGFVFYVSGSVQNTNIQAEAQKVLNDIVASQPLRFYVSQCGDKALASGIDILSKQGGIIFSPQPGALVGSEKSYPYVDQNTTYFVSYAIFKSPINTPQYPCIPGYNNFNIPPAYCYYSSLNPLFNNMPFGIINMPKLCKDGNSGCSSTEGGWDVSFSVQKELESYISAYIQNCVNFQSIQSINTSFNIQEGNITDSVFFSDTGISATINFPLSISPTVGQPIVNLYSFESTQKTRFKLAYSLARSAVVMSATSPNAPTFNISSGFLSLASAKFNGGNSGFDIERHDDVVGHDILFRILDTEADPKNPLALQFLIEKRPPVLNYLDIFGPYGNDSYPQCGTYDIIGLENEPITISPTAFDTEQQYIHFSYSGWLENYNDTDIVIKSTTGGCPTINYNSVPLAQSRWTKSSNFIISGNATANLVSSDDGPHELNITVCNAEYCDSETIRILIDDLLKLSLNATNPYQTSDFSFEDPYSITAVTQKLYNPGNYQFSWEIDDSNGIPIYRNMSATNVLNLPLSPYDITNIKTSYGEMFNSPSLFFTVKSIVEVNVPHEEDYSVENETILYPKACIYHPNGGPPFPYNTLDPFLADAACCNPGGIISGLDEICYQNKTYGSYLSFNLSKYVNSYDSSQGLYPTAFLPPSQPSLSDLIFERSFTRNCDGTRGNICTGLIQEIIKPIVPSCSDITSSTIADCSGPSIPLLQPNSETPDINQAKCIHYDGTNFQNLTQHASIQCNKYPKCVADPNSEIGFTDSTSNQAHYLCNATCGTNGCSQTTNNLCHNCYSDQTCTPYQGQGYISYTQVDATPCSGSGTPSASCQLIPSSSHDSCQNNVLVQYFCKPSSSIDSSNVPYYNKTTDCSSLDSASNSDTNPSDVVPIPGSKCVQVTGLCSGLVPPSCSTGNTQTWPDGPVVSDASGDFAYNYYIVQNNACIMQSKSYDSLTANYCKLSSFNGVQGRMVSGHCCGSSATDNTNPTCKGP